MIGALLMVPPDKKADPEKLPSPDEVNIKVNQKGYFLENGDPVSEALQLKRGHVKLVFHYDESLVDALGTTHSITVSNNVTGFSMQSTALSSDSKTAVIEFNVGENGEKEYLFYCNVSCPAMVNLFRKIVVIENASLPLATSVARG